MSWLESHQELRHHPKTARLRRRLGVSLPTAIGHLHLFWWWALDYATDGDISAHDADVIADAASWDDEPGQFVRALIAAGFVNEDLTIHDWDDYAGRLIERREANAKRMRDARAARRARLDADQPYESRPAHATGERAAHVQGLPDRTGPDHTGPDRTLPPLPPLRTANGGDDTPGRNGVTKSIEPADQAVWATAVSAISGEADTPAWQSNVELYITPLQPLGRADDGALYLRAPPGLARSVERFRPHIAKALVDAGDAGGGAIAIVE